MTGKTRDLANAREQARRILHDLQIDKAPIPVERIAKSIQVTIRYAPLEEELSGMAFIKDGVKAIGVNALHHPNRQRFTLAHELGHHVLHVPELLKGVHVDKVIMKRDMLAASGTDNMEVEANAFASELLMPDFLIAAISDQNVDLNDEAKLLSLARRFKVSVAALQFRLAAID